MVGGEQTKAVHDGLVNMPSWQPIARPTLPSRLFP